MEEKFHCVDCGIESGEPEAKQANYRCPDCGAELAGDNTGRGI